MLKALELVGFKSFADKTRFDFPDGITVIVGPNGSGKSNIVDAMKWVLGSQSPKALRGKDMSDVIFKGSTTRGPSATAEVTIVFDNPDGALPYDAPEVRVTRRVYRSGEGEYLINAEPVRLKDVRDLIRGTGVGIDAYSLIEQGKVDRMLQASAKDRRAIFEEAAGISRFKAKKIEAERRLARVQSNLTRLGDIVDEVATRLRSLRGQASKAERYRQASEELKALRMNLAWTDWRELSTRYERSRTELDAATRRRDELESARQEITLRRQTADAQLQTIADTAVEIESKRSNLVQAIATFEGRRDADAAAAEDVRAAMKNSFKRIRILQSQASGVAAELRDATEQLDRYRQQWHEIRDRAAEIESRRERLQAETDQLRSSHDDLVADHTAMVRNVARLESSLQSTRSRRDEADRSIATLSKRADIAEEHRDRTRGELDKAENEVAQLDEQLAETDREIEIADAQLAQTRRTLDRRREETSALKIRLRGISERAAVLRDLEQRHEGLTGGVRTILDTIAGDASELSGDVHGIVADCFDVDVEVAPLVDAALGDQSQFVVTTDGSLQEAIAEGRVRIDSRVGLIRLDELPPRRPGDRIRLDGLAGVLGRADRMVQSDERFEPLVRHLLSNTWLVDHLSTALKLRKLSGAGLRFVTSTGELLENDGSLVVGPAAAAGSLVSRRSELASADQEIEHYEFQIRSGEDELERLVALVDDEAAQAGRIEKLRRGLANRRAAAEAVGRHIAERLETQHAACEEIESELRIARQQRNEAITQVATLEGEIKSGHLEAERLQQRLAEVDEMLSESQSALRDATAGAMSIAVDVARAEQKYESLDQSLDARRRDQGQRQQAVEEVRGEVAMAKRRIDEANLRILDANARLADAYVEGEMADQQLRELASRADAVREENREVIRRSEQAISMAGEAAAAVHAITQTLDNAKIRLDSLAQRVSEDYQIDLRIAEPPEDYAPPDDREAVEAKIANLRGQLQRTSNVNMEALAELETLQNRYDELHGQYQDLTAAKDSLQRVIGRINADSRRLFLDTLEAIRQNFTLLYRKSFGGGHADLVLEDTDDPLEAGVEIVATPPGKPSFNNSLLSGGEKALTAVALLMSIFKYRPSPFCVLDEVDAPFDEANIGRFVTVLNEFLDQSKFVVVTHSKKTMTAATTLYGVTMQESGVSKQVSIRFEDVSGDQVGSEGEAA